MNKILIFLTLFFVGFSICMIFNKYDYADNHNNLTTQEKVIESVVFVENSSGILIYQDQTMALVLSAAHVIYNEDAKEPFTAHMIIIYGENEYAVDFQVSDYDVDIDLDLAILRTEPFGHTQILPAKIVSFDDEPKIGDEVYIAANPNTRWRSLKKGILSSKFRKSELGIISWEVDAMIIFGSSGGGAFTKDGKLFGIVSSIDSFPTDYCSGINNERCLEMPLPNLGFIIPPQSIRHFLRNSTFSDYFKFN